MNIFLYSSIVWGWHDLSGIVAKADAERFPEMDINQKVNACKKAIEDGDRTCDGWNRIT